MAEETREENIGDLSPTPAPLPQPGLFILYYDPIYVLTRKRESQSCAQTSKKLQTPPPVAPRTGSLHPTSTKCFCQRTDIVQLTHMPFAVATRTTWRCGMHRLLNSSSK